MMIGMANDIAIEEKKRFQNLFFPSLVPIREIGDIGRISG